jgi:type VI secretion system protein ImpD
VITDRLDRTLGEFGFLPFCWCQDTTVAAFHGCQTIQKAREQSTAEATANARLSTMLPYILCASRFAHYIKVMVRDQTGGHSTAEIIQQRLSQWLLQYTLGSGSGGGSTTAELRARHPLRDASVDVRDAPGKPGKYICQIHLMPQFQLDNLVGSIELRTRP